MAPSGTMDKQLEYMKEQCHTWAQAMQECKLSKRDVYKAYHNVLIPKICYPFATTTLTEKEFKGLHVIVDKVYLQRAGGLNRHFPLEILHGPSEYGEIEHKTLYDRQGMAQLKLHIGSIRNNEDSAKLVKTSLEITQLELGLGTPIMERTTKNSIRNLDRDNSKPQSEKVYEDLRSRVDIYRYLVPSETAEGGQISDEGDI